jgi:methionyl-tRNA formyltransferase
VYQPRRLAEELDPFRAAKVEVAVVAAYGEVLTALTLAVPPRGFLNVHPSLLPRLRGATPVPSAILEGLSETGVTVMQVGLGVDSGPTLAQVGEPIRGDDTGGSLLARLADLGADLLVETLPRWLDGSIAPRRQDSRRATYSRTLRRDDGRADFTQPAVELWRRARAYQPWPGFFTTWQGKNLKLPRVEPLPSRRGHRPGEVFMADAGVAVGCGTGALRLVELQLEGKRAMGADEFVRGQAGFLGSQL